MKTRLKTGSRKSASSLEDYANLIAYKNEKFPQDILLTTITEMAGKASPQALKTLTDEFTKAASKTKIDSIITAGLDVAEQALQQLAAAKFDSFDISSELKHFGNEMKDVLQGLEDAFVKAGMTPDTDLLPTFKKFLQIEKAPAGYQRPAPKNGKGNNGFSFGKIT